MKGVESSLMQLILVVAATAANGWGQGTPTRPSVGETHVKDIAAEQTRAMIMESRLCQEAREIKENRDLIHDRAIDPATLEPSLYALMQKSEEVVLVGRETASTIAISPSGEDLVEYFDAKVLKTWKGSHQPGDVITFARPGGHARCAQINPDKKKWTPGFVTWIDPRPDSWKEVGDAIGRPMVLFLRQTRRDDPQLSVGLRLTGGDGVQGMFVIQSEYIKDCNGVLPGSVARCNAVLEDSSDSVSIFYRYDPLFKQYDGVPLSTFLRELQSVADSLGYKAQASAK